MIHPTAPVAPVVLALAESRGASGAALLTALALGMEVECRIGNAVSPAHYARGWHITATCGVFGAAAAAAKLLGLSPARTAHALGIAASESAGLVENLTTAAKNIGVGNAARNGLLAALMAEAGYEAAPRAIEGPLGWARASGDAPDMALMLGGLGEDWELLDNAFKPYPSGVVLHAVIDACLELRAAHRLDAATIDSVVVSGDALLLARGDRVGAERAGCAGLDPAQRRRRLPVRRGGPRRAFAGRRPTIRACARSAPSSARASTRRCRRARRGSRSASRTAGPSPPPSSTPAAASGSR